ncbi:conserved hypothetical protein [Neospora caninum Liverpool]|nr:conserved hypothetical protein [Neospora caninum Liverpool]CBZ49715.1 conserved hypothetical protein [Neospora caninum Liverpool]|eukprot:XP_003879750.1 conserved hypothetical protein [Neospora caninum Liverpool]
MVSQSSLSTPSQASHWAKAATRWYRRCSEARLHQATQMESQANRIQEQLQAAGVQFSSPGGDGSLRLGTSDQASSTGGDASAPGAKTESSVPVVDRFTCLRYGLDTARKQAAALRDKLEKKELCIAQVVALRVAQSTNHNPTDRRIAQWSAQAKSHFSDNIPRWQKRAAKLEALTAEWEHRIATGAVQHEEPHEGTSSGTGAPQRAPGSVAAKRRRPPRRQTRSESATTAVTTVPPVGGAYPATEPEGSLRGTLLGSTVELPGTGRVSFAQLAIDKLRRDADSRLHQWRDLDSHVRSTIASRMIRESNRSPSPAMLRRWVHTAQASYTYRSCIGHQEARDLKSIAEDIEKKAAAAGVLLRSSQEPTTQGPEPPSQQPATQTDGISGGSAHTSAPECSGITFAHIAIADLRRHAQQIRQKWCTGRDVYVLTQVAERMVRNNMPSPPTRIVRMWKAEASSRHSKHSSERAKQADALEAQALALEQELRNLLASSSGYEPEPSPDAESTADRSNEPPPGKRNAKRKHLTESSAGSPGESTSCTGIKATPNSLWITPIAAFSIRGLRQRGGRGADASRGVPESSTPQPSEPSGGGSDGTPGHSAAATELEPLTTGQQLPARPEIVPAGETPYPSAAGAATPLPASEGGPAEIAPVPPKKRRLLHFVAAQNTERPSSPSLTAAPFGRRSPTPTQTPGPPLASGPHLPPSLPAAHDPTSASIPARLPSWTLPLKKRPVRPVQERATVIQWAAASTPHSGHGPFSSGPLATLGVEALFRPHLPPSGGCSEPESASGTASGGDTPIRPRTLDPQ